MKLSVKKIIRFNSRRIITETSCEYEPAGWDSSESNVENIQMLFRQMIIALEKPGGPVIKDAVNKEFKRTGRKPGWVRRFFRRLWILLEDPSFGPPVVFPQLKEGDYPPMPKCKKPKKIRIPTGREFDAKMGF